jgi:membrane protein YqaA with SNARE-associated domain
MHRHIYLKILLIVIFISLSFYIGKQAQNNEFISELINSFGYWGVFIIAIISGFNLVVPIPAIAFLPLFVTLGMNAPLIVLVISFGMLIADSIAFLIGKTGRQVIIHTKFQIEMIEKLDKFRERNHYLPYVILLIFISSMPVPNELIVIPMSFLGYSFYSIFPFLLLGNLIFNITAGAGILGILSLF